jgi:hypothetical protein
MADLKPPAHHTPAAHWAAWLAMKYTKGNAKEAQDMYTQLIPEDPIAKWKEFAERLRAHLRFAPPCPPGPAGHSRLRRQ